MKKILCGILCASAGAALAVQSTVTTIDVIEVRSDLTNVVIAIPGEDLAGGNLAISNLVKTANLTQGDKLFAFDNGSYQAWVLTGGKWVEVTTAEKDNDGKVDVVAGTPAADKKMLVGEGIWLHRQNPSSSKPFYVYGAAHASASTIVTADATVLLGNPKTVNASPSISGAQDKDKIIVPTATFPTYYSYNGEESKWQYIVGASIESSATPPSITAGTGFWYKASEASGKRTITW